MVKKTKSQVKKRTNSVVMVTGASGSLAQGVIERLRRNHQVIAVDFREQPPQQLDGVTPYMVDLTKRDFEEIFRSHAIESVIHLGRIEFHAAGQQRRYNANVIGTQKLLRMCEKYQVEQVVILSTYHVYGAHPFNSALLKEDSPLKASHVFHDLVDAVELESLAQLNLWKHPELNITILRPCNIIGPGLNNTISRIFQSRRAPVMAGFSPMMQFIHVEDMADAVVCATHENVPGVYNIAPSEVISWQDAVNRTGCRRIVIPSIPPALPRMIARLAVPVVLPEYIINYPKYPVVIDGELFNQTFEHQFAFSTHDILDYYRDA
jgi:UDP-glucose 4-epimerase